jgi:hypothetical protein
MTSTIICDEVIAWAEKTPPIAEYVALAAARLAAAPEEAA